MTVTLAIDCMGGDHGPSVTVPAALHFMRADREARIVLVGRAEAIEQHLGTAQAEFGERLRIQRASEVVGMDEPPALAMRNKKDSSMRVSVDLVKTGEAQAAVSAGNTGALMAISRLPQDLAGHRSSGHLQHPPHLAGPDPRAGSGGQRGLLSGAPPAVRHHGCHAGGGGGAQRAPQDRKSTRLNSSHT